MATMACCPTDTVSAADAALLEMLTGPLPPTTNGVLPSSSSSSGQNQKQPQAKFSRRDAALDPLMIAAAAASGPHVTRNHYLHDFLPGVTVPPLDDLNAKTPKRHLVYTSRQAPRRQRLGLNLQEVNGIPEAAKENDSEGDLKPSSPVKRRRPSLVTSIKPPAAASAPEPVTVRCMARTRIPTPHGPAFLHLYHNSRDAKEHLAIVIDPAQYSESSSSGLNVPAIRSRSLDAVWDEHETEMDRITRGAYVGRLSPTSKQASTPAASSSFHVVSEGVPPPLVRIHSECFTGETVGSMRCDCGEQLDEALRLISQPISISSPSSSDPTTIPGRGAVVYLRQEGRGIGLLSKIRAYNLQDLGHDTVTANLMLGHGADERGYEVAAAIMRDLGLDESEGVRLLTNNPDKVEALQREGTRVAERVPMVPRSWRARAGEEDPAGPGSGATMIGAQAVHGPDLDKYLQTKVLRMGHMLPLWAEGLASH